LIYFENILKLHVLSSVACFRKFSIWSNFTSTKIADAT